MAHDLVCQNPACSKSFQNCNPNVKCCSRVCRNAALDLLYNRVPLAVRFWAKVQQCVHGDFCPFCCWEWTASRNPANYGYFGVKENGEWITRLAHTVGWELINERPIPDGLQINHHCDNPPCCSIWHIYAGTRTDNMLDAQRRDRLAKGEARSFLTTQDVLSMPVLYRQGYSLHELAEKFQANLSTIANILNGKAWKHLNVALSKEERHELSLAHRHKPRGPYKKRIQQT